MRFAMVFGRVAQIPVALVLLVAAGLKVHQLSTTPLTENLVFQSRAFETVLAGMEVLMGLWLLTQCKQRAAQIVCGMVFLVFASFSLSKLVRGEDSCGCFGVVQVSPIISFAIDISAIICLSCWTPGIESRRWLGFVSALGIIAVLAVIVLPSTLRTTTFADGDDLGEGIVVLELDKWIGRQLPIAKFVRDIDQIQNGRWLIVLYHEDCPRCQQLISDASDSQPGQAMMFVELPPYKSPHRNNGRRIVWSKLSDNREWFVSAPCLIETSDGVVVDVEWPGR